MRDRISSAAGGANPNTAGERTWDHQAALRRLQAAAARAEALAAGPKPHRSQESARGSTSERGGLSHRGGGASYRGGAGERAQGVMTGAAVQGVVPGGEPVKLRPREVAPKPFRGHMVGAQP